MAYRITHVARPYVVRCRTISGVPLFWIEGPGCMGRPPKDIASAMKRGHLLSGQLFAEIASGYARAYWAGVDSQKPTPR